MTAPAPSAAGRVGLLRRQFDLTWSLFEYHLERLVPEDFLREPAPLCWTLRRSPEGSWVPDRADTEPDPVPVPTVAWVSRHIGWWWSLTLDHARGERPRERTEILWPGAGEPTLTWLRFLRTERLAHLDTLTDADLDTPAPFPSSAHPPVQASSGRDGRHPTRHYFTALDPNRPY